MDRGGPALDGDFAEIAILEKIADAAARVGSDQHGVGRRHFLHACRQVWRLADDTAFLRGAFPNQVADDDQPAGDTDADGESPGRRVELGDPLGKRQAGAHRPLRVVLVRRRIAEIQQHAVAHVFRDKPAEPPGFVGDGGMVAGDHLAQILRVEAGRKQPASS